MFFKKVKTALAGVAQWIESWPVNQKVTGLIPSQGTYLDYVFGPQLGHVQEATNTCFSLASVSFPHFLPPFTSL